MSTTDHSAGEPGIKAIERYLDHLFDALAGSGASGRRVLAEAEGHLFTAYEKSVGQGMSPAEAAAAAIERFGRADEVSASTRAAGALPVGTIIRKSLSGAWLIGTAGLICLGISGLLVRLLGHVAGRAFLTADPSGVTYTAARCREYFEYAPGASSCAQAAIAHHFDELVFSREAAGVLGLLCAGAWWLFVRRADSRWRSPIGATMAVGAVAAGLIGLGSAGAGLLAYLFGAHSGFGALFPDAAAAFIGAALFGTLSIRRARSGRGQTSS